MTRIIAGQARGRRLAVPAGSSTRPTADRAREALFSSLEASLGGWSGTRVLDLYAGTGAVGLEALSRGAAQVTLVESQARVAEVLRRNVATVGLPGATVLVQTVEQFVERAHTPSGSPAATSSDRQYDVVFLDPPYSLEAQQLIEILVRLVTAGMVADLIVTERASRDRAWRWPEGIEPMRDRRYGEATFWYGRAAARREPDD